MSDVLSSHSPSREQRGCPECSRTWWRDSYVTVFGSSTYGDMRVSMWGIQRAVTCFVRNSFLSSFSCVLRGQYIQRVLYIHTLRGFYMSWVPVYEPTRARLSYQCVLRTGCISRYTHDLRSWARARRKKRARGTTWLYLHTRCALLGILSSVILVLIVFFAHCETHLQGDVSHARENAPAWRLASTPQRIAVPLIAKAGRLRSFSLSFGPTDANTLARFSPYPNSRTELHWEAKGGLLTYICTWYSGVGHGFKR